MDYVSFDCGASEAFCVAIVEGEETDLVDDEQADGGVELETPVESSCRLLSRQIEEKLSG